MGARGLQLFLLLLVILAAFALRIHALEYQSFWSDEGLSLYRARQPLSAVFANTITVDGIDTKDTNPAFYFLLLHGWRSLAGESVFALRFLGAALATLSVPLIYVVATAVLGRWSGLATAVFLAVSPLHVWQSQILRNYGLLVTLNLLSVYGLVRFMQSAGSRRRWRWLGVWAAAGFLSIFSHYFGFFVMAYGALVLTLYLLNQWLRPATGRRKLPGRWFWLILGLLLMLLIPLTLTAYDRFQIGQQIDFYQTPPLDFFTHAIHVFSAGDIPGIIHPWQRVWPAALLAALGLIFGWRRSRAGTLFILGYQLIPLGLL
ncbi:MAG: glycosyltransferase family 39 protein, partial [Chloroflexota bacterium]